jgi:DNA-binding protein Fis
MNTSVLTDKVKAGNLWSKIKKIFKKGKNFVKNAVDYIDNSPILSTVKDVASDYIQEKTGINPNDYYNMTKNVVNSSNKEIRDAVTNATVNTIKDVAKKRKERKTGDQKAKKSNTREEIKNIMTTYKDNLIKEIPDQTKRINENFNFFSRGISEGGGAPLAALKPTLWKKWGPMFLLADKGTGKCGSVASDLLKTKYKLNRLVLPKTLKDMLNREAKDGKGRLYMGRGEDEEASGGKKKNEKYMKLLASLKK